MTGVPAFTIPAPRPAMKMPTVRVVICDDHAVLRTGIRLILDRDDGIDVVGEAASGAEALRLVRAAEPHVLLLDMELPDTTGVEVARQLAAEQSATRVLALSAYDDRAYVSNLLQSGAAGYITKDKDPSLVVEAVKAVARGEGRWFVSMSPSGLADSPLTGREEEVLRHMASGLSNTDIAEALSISVNTVRNHVSSIYSKLGVRSWREAVAWAWEHGLSAA